MRIQMNRQQQIMGTKRRFITLDSTDYSYGESSRIQFLWEQNTQHGARLMIKVAWKEEIIRMHDIFIIDKIYQDY